MADVCDGEVIGNGMRGLGDDQLGVVELVSIEVARRPEPVVSALEVRCSAAGTGGSGRDAFVKVATRLRSPAPEFGLSISSLNLPMMVRVRCVSGPEWRNRQTQRT